MRPAPMARPLQALTSASTIASRSQLATLARSQGCSQRIRPAAASLSLSSSFSTTSACQLKTIKSHNLPDRVIPEYPYGERRVYKQSNRGLYGSARIRFGNVVAPKYKNKSKRFWRPNIHVKVFKSHSIGARIKTRLTLRVLKTIRKEGGLEEYLLKSKPARIKEMGPGGWNLRWLLMQTTAVQERFNKQRVAMGLEPRAIEDRSDLIQYALDFATPGKLSIRSRSTLAEIKEAESLAMVNYMEQFVLGDKALADVEGVEELSDEAEAELLGAAGEDDAEIDMSETEEAIKELTAADAMEQTKRAEDKP